MPLDQLNHFKKFNFEEVFQINNEELEAQYLKLQQQFHPDIASDKIEAEINSILINQAYKILKNPLKRAIYLLQLQGINIDDEANFEKPSQDILLFIMELREEILENEQNSAKIREVKQKIKNFLNDEMALISNLLAKQQYQLATQNLIKAKYLDKILLDLKSANKLFRVEHSNKNL